MVESEQNVMFYDKRYGQNPDMNLDRSLVKKPEMMRPKENSFT